MTTAPLNSKSVRGMNDQSFGAFQNEPGKKDAVFLRGSGSFHLVTHSPRRLERRGRGMGGKDLILRQSADPSGTATNGAQLALRDTASVAADGACVAAVVRLGELAGRSKVQCGESGRLPEKMAVWQVSIVMVTQ